MANSGLRDRRTLAARDGDLNGHVVCRQLLTGGIGSCGIGSGTHDGCVESWKDD